MKITKIDSVHALISCRADEIEKNPSNEYLISLCRRALGYSSETVLKIDVYIKNNGILFFTERILPRYFRFSSFDEVAHASQNLSKDTTSTLIYCDGNYYLEILSDTERLGDACDAPYGTDKVLMFPGFAVYFLSEL